VFSPDGRFVYVSAEEDDKLEVIDVAARKLVAQLKVGNRPRGIAFTPDAPRRTWPAKGPTPSTCSMRASTGSWAPSRRARAPNGLAMHPDGKRLYLTNGGDASVMVIDTAADKVVATIPVGQRPWNMALTRDGAKLYVANGRSDSVSVIDTAKNARLQGHPGRQDALGRQHLRVRKSGSEPDFCWVATSFSFGVLAYFIRQLRSLPIRLHQSRAISESYRANTGRQ